MTIPVIGFIGLGLMGSNKIDAPLGRTPAHAKDGLLHIVICQKAGGYQP